MVTTLVEIEYEAVVELVDGVVGMVVVVEAGRSPGANDPLD